MLFRSSGQPVPGVNVTIAGTSLGAVTDADGRYTIAGVPAGTHEVHANMIGYAELTREATVEDGESVTADFELSTDAILLEGIVAVGYGTQQRRNVTGSIGTVQAAEIREIPTANVVQAMQGRLAGVDIVAAGGGAAGGMGGMGGAGAYRPGAGMNIRIRGVRSAVATNDPLFVVDGIPISGGIQDFNPANVESIEVLKDASATAIYGSRGANGVVLITTTEGPPGGVRFTYDTYAGIQRPINLVDMMNGEEFAEYRREAWRNANEQAPRNTADSVIFVRKERWSLRNGVDVDWQDLILRTGVQQSHQLGITGVTGNTRFSFSGNYFDQRGITIGQDFNRYSATLSVEHTMDRLRFGVTATGSRSVADIGQGDGLWGTALANSPLGVVYDTLAGPPTLEWKPGDDPLLANPLSHVDNWLRQETRNRLFASLFAELELLNGLHWRVNFGPDLADRQDGDFQGRFTTARNEAPAAASRTERETFAYTLDNLLQLDRTIGTTHRVEATALYSIQSERFDSTHAAAENLPFEQQLWHNLGTGDVRADLQSGLREWTLQSFMARVNYSFADRYLLTVAGRYDGSSRLAAGNKWAFFPSVGLGWQLGDEAFMQSLGFVSNLKLRASYGRTGNTGIDPYQTQGAVDRTRYNFGDQTASGFRPGQIRNPDLGWEKADQYDIGVEFGLFANRITGTVDLYRQDTKDLLLTRQLPGSSGFTETLQNVGETRNTGIEIGLSTVNLDGWNGVRWTSDINLTHSKNEIVSLFDKTQDDVLNRWFIGQPITIGDVIGDRGNADAMRQVFFDFVSDGIWQEDEAEEAAAFGQRPGEIKVKDLNGNGMIDDGDRAIIGDSYPDWLVNIYNRFTWKNFDLSALVSARLGYMFYDAFGTGNSQLAGRFNNLNVDYWTPDNPTGVQPRPDNQRENPLYGNTRGYVDGSHWRVRNITLGYTLPQSLVSRFRATSLRIYATAQEPFVFTDYVGYDPEAGHAATPPSYWTLLLGANLSF